MSSIFQSFRPLLYLLFIATTLGLQSCGDDGLTHYHERLVGEWQLSNAGDLQPFYNDKPFTLKSAIMVFEDNGTLETRVLNSKDQKTWMISKGTWSVTQSPNTNTLVENETLTIKADDGPFHDNMYISFIDERTFFVAINELEYEFVKL